MAKSPASPASPSTALPSSIDDTIKLLARADYVAERSLATAVFLALKMGRPLFLEGEAGVGKTEIAKVLSAMLGRKLVRLQCYEGLDIASAVYEWNYSRQMIEIRLAEAEGRKNAEGLAQDIFAERFLIRRPVLQALEGPPGAAPVLLIDELDRTDEPFEAYLLEVLSDFQVTIPEIGTIQAQTPPLVILTSNNTRELGDALKRRCLHLHVGFPDADREQQIVRARVPDIAQSLLKQMVDFVQSLREQDIRKLPSISETVDWARTLLLMHAEALDPALVRSTLSVLLKRQTDVISLDGKLDSLTHAVVTGPGAAS